MKDRIEELIRIHRLLSEECWTQLNELNQLDLTKFGKKEAEELKLSIMELTLEASLRRAFVSEIETLIEP